MTHPSRPFVSSSSNNNKILPRILCLHGGGVSARIFDIQTRRLQHALRHHFRFVFVDAPFEGIPGPGILPFFEGCGPYFRWAQELDGEDEKAALRSILERLGEEGRSAGEEPFVGVLGFSQGARVAAGLLLNQQQKYADGLREDEELKMTSRLKFGVLCMGTYPPLRLQAPCPSSTFSSPNSPRSSTSAISDVDTYDASLLNIPTVHIHGKHDPWKPDSLRLLGDCRAAEVMEFDGGHHLPTLQADTNRLAKMILGAFDRGQKFYGGDSD